MSDQLPPRASPPPIPPRPGDPPPRNGCLTALLLVLGLIMLLPGLCALLFGGMALTQPHFDSGFLSFILVGLAFGFGGVMLIWHVIRGPR